MVSSSDSNPYETTMHLMPMETVVARRKGDSPGKSNSISPSSGGGGEGYGCHIISTSSGGGGGRIRVPHNANE
jgi:hypothetical protein